MFMYSQPFLLGSAAAPAPADPVTGYRAWYRGDQFAAGTWTDLSGNGFHLTSPSGNPPTAIATDANFNNKPTVDFDGTNDRLTSSGETWADFITNSAFTIFGVVRAEAYGASDDTGSTQRGILSGPPGNGSVGIGFGSSKLQGWAWDGNTDITGPASSLNTVYGFDFRHSAGNVLFLRSGTTETSTASGNTTGLTSDEFQMGADFQSDTFFNGQIAEIIVYNTVLSVADRQTTRDYLAGRYGFTW